MPVCHITLRRGLTLDFIDKLSAALQQALVTQFEVPVGDCFQIFHEIESDKRRFDPHYLSAPRSKDWTLIEITAGKPRSLEVKRAVYRDLADRLSISPGITPADLMVVIRHNQPEDWSFGLGLATMIESKEIAS